MTVGTAVVSNLSQFEKLSSEVPVNQVALFTDNGAFRRTLVERHAPFVYLDDFTVKDHWEEINRWACSEALKWIVVCQNNERFKGFDLPSAIYLFFSHLLAHGLKNLHFSKHLLDHSSGPYFIFDDRLPDYPNFSGNRYFNHFIRTGCEERGLPYKILPLTNHSISQGPNRQSLLKNILKRLFLLIFPHVTPSDILVVGSLKHLAEILSTSQRDRLDIALYDSSFHPRIAFWCLRHRIPYILPDHFKHSRTGFHFTVSDLQSTLDDPECRSLFIYRGEDLKPFIREHIFSTFESYLTQLTATTSLYHALFDELKPRLLVTEDDYSLRGGVLCAYSKIRKVPAFTISHANLAVDFSVPKELRVFSQSTTFVNAPFERDMYAARGWAANNFVVSGTPRYDKMIRSFQSRTVRRAKRIKLLYCANTYFADQTPQDYGYIGMYVNSFRDIVQPAAEAILRAIKNLPIDLWIKPHNMDGIVSWQKLIRESGVASQIKLVSNPGAGIMSLINEADAMILSYWSTTLIEAAMCELPVLFLDLAHKKSPALESFASHGFCTVLRTESDLVDALMNLKPFQRGGVSWANLSQEEVKYYLGNKDTSSTKRILNHLKQNLYPRVTSKQAILSKDPLLFSR